jgi:hypothetical protein
MALTAAVLCSPVSTRAQSGAGLDIDLEAGRLSLNVKDASLSTVLREIAAKGDFALDIAGELDSKVTASFENVPIERALRRIVGGSSYIIELAPPGAEGEPRRIGKLSVFARSAPVRVETTRKPRRPSVKPGATETRGGNRTGTGANSPSRRRPRSPSS